MTGLDIPLPGFASWRLYLSAASALLATVSLGEAGELTAQWALVPCSDVCLELYFVLEGEGLLWPGPGPVRALWSRSAGWRALSRPSWDPPSLRDALLAGVHDAGLSPAPAALLDAVVSAVPDGSPLLDLVLVMGS